MFKQFIQNFADSRIYLISSLWLFLIFFLLVAFMLIRMKKNHIDYMSHLPLAEDEDAVELEKEAVTHAS
jgi:cbb3-type cytochrome oxidase subunit 3